MPNELQFILYSIDQEGMSTQMDIIKIKGSVTTNG